jgi:hypothetical protein
LKRFGLSLQLPSVCGSLDGGHFCLKPVRFVVTFQNGIKPQKPLYFIINHELLWVKGKKNYKAMGKHRPLITTSPSKAIGFSKREIFSAVERSTEV